MSSPLRPLSVGDPSPLVRNRQAINEVLRVARKDAARGGAQVPGSVPALNVNPTATVYVRNDTAGDLDSWAVLALGDPEPDLTDDDAAHTWRGQPVFPGAAPAASSDPFGVLLHPVKAGAVGAAAVLGVVPVDLNVTDSSHTHASPAASTTATLATGTSGPAVIVSKESGTGTKRAAVLLTGQAGGTHSRLYSTTTFTTTSITGAIGVGWTDVTGASRTITEAGLYQTWASGAFLMNISAGSPGIMYAVIRDSGGTVLAGSAPASVTVTGSNVLHSFYLTWLLDLDGGDVPYTFKLSGARNGATWTTSQINSSATTLTNEVGYVRIAP